MDGHRFATLVVWSMRFPDNMKQSLDSIRASPLSRAHCCLMWYQWVMVAMRGFLGTVLFILTAAGCSSSGSSDGSGGSGATQLHPPPNVDLTRCASVMDASDLASLEACGKCCTPGGFPEATFYNGQCVCGKPLDDTGSTVCAAQTATADACSSCCTSANFLGDGWVGGSAAACVCSDKSDATSCASTLKASSPDTACGECCLNLGYLGEVYVGFGTPECQCTGG